MKSVLDSQDVGSFFKNLSLILNRENSFKLLCDRNASIFFFEKMVN